jgi:hypothetical protein
MGSCAAPSAKGDDKFITTDYLQQCRIFAFAQYAPYNGQEHAFSLTYLLNLFFLHVVMVPYYEFFQTEIYSNVLMSLADESGQMIRFHHVVPVLGI